MAGIYIHIPFCSSRCIYCGFYSTTLGREAQDRYVDALLKEFSQRKEYLKGEKVHTIYIGGGTPSLLSEENLHKIYSGVYSAVVPINREKEGGSILDEFTVECNPDDVTTKFAALLKEIGVTRVSMGAQTFNDKRLRFIHRRHKAEQISSAVKTVRDAGIGNISVDLMFGFPGETIEEWENDIDKAIELDVEHISAYSLMYEEGTPLYSLMEKGKIKEVDEEISVEMYDILIDKLTSAGYEHYEISNFAKQGYRSRHNSSYWDGTSYLGLGAGAHSYDGETRGWNVRDIEKYIEEWGWDGVPNTEDHRRSRSEEGQGPRSDGEKEQAMEYEVLDDDTKYNDMVTTALRTREGIDLNCLQEKYYYYILRNARKGLEHGLLVLENGHLRLTRKGVFVSNDVMSDLIYVDE